MGGVGGDETSSVPVAVVSSSTSILEALIARGIPLFPLDPALPDAVIADLCRQAGVRSGVVDRHIPGLERLSVEHALQLPPSGHMALLLSTSGSSGRPKAVMLTKTALEAAARASQAVTPLGAGDRWLACLPLFHMGGYSILSRCRLAGACAIVHQGFEPERVLHSLRTEAISHLSLVPAMLSRLLDLSPAPPPPSLRHVLVGGAALTSDLAERAAGLGWPIQPSYGMSEMASQVATLPRLSRPWPPGLVGRPLPGVEAALTPDGRLKLRGPMMMAGYANPTRMPGDGIEEGWLVTNDLAEIGPDGTLTILGRGDDIIVSAGNKISPLMVEEALARCPGLVDVAVLGLPDPVWGAVVAVVYAGEPEEEALLGWCRDVLASPLRPRRAIRLAALPRLSNGKTDRVALRGLVEGLLGQIPAGGQADGESGSLARRGGHLHPTAMQIDETLHQGKA
jgi:O-succinylbenzoic acid--CoA ligase